MKVEIKVADNDTGNIIAKSVYDVTVSAMADAMAMFEATWSKDSTPATPWVVVSRPHYNIRKRVWNLGDKFGMHSKVTIWITKEVA